MQHSKAQHMHIYLACAHLHAHTHTHARTHARTQPCQFIVLTCCTEALCKAVSGASALICRQGQPLQVAQCQRDTGSGAQSET